MRGPLAPAESAEREVPALLDGAAVTAFPEPAHHNGPRRRVNYDTVLRLWQAGLDGEAIAEKVKITREGVYWIVRQARAAGWTVRRPEEPGLAHRLCEACDRPLTPTEQLCKPILSDPSIYCAFCARRWDGGLYVTDALRTLIDGEAASDT